MKKEMRKQVDIGIRYLFRVVSYFSVVALAAMLIFIFYQGIIPFVSSTAPSIRLVTEHIPEIQVNGSTYVNHRTFIDVPSKDDEIAISFEHQGEHIDFQLELNPDKTNPEQAVRFPASLAEQVTSPEANTYTITFPGGLPGLEKKIHINIPEPPYRFLAFLLGDEWRPVYRKLYGILPMITATLLTTFGAVLLGVPIALLASVMIAEFLSPKSALFVRSSIDLLAGIPSVVYGFFGLMIIVPIIQRVFGSASGSSLLAAVIVLSIMILPTVISITITSLEAVPESYREASLALGATKMQTSWRIVFPAARSGILAGGILGTSRAVGETMAVILVAGNSPQFPSSLTDSVRTMTATIALEMGYSAGRHNQMLFSIGVILFVIICVLNGIIMKLKQHMLEDA